MAQGSVESSPHFLFVLRLLVEHRESMVYGDGVPVRRLAREQAGRAQPVEERGAPVVRLDQAAPAAFLGRRGDHSNGRQR